MLLQAISIEPLSSYGLLESAERGVKSKDVYLGKSKQMLGERMSKIRVRGKVVQLQTV